MIDRKKQRFDKLLTKIFGILLGLCLVVSMSIGTVYADNVESSKLQNGSFEEGQSWINDGPPPPYRLLNQSQVPYWNTTAYGEEIELFGENTNIYLKGVTLIPSAGYYAAELNANEESTLYQNVRTRPFSIYQWGLDHGARNGTDTMALVIGPGQDVEPSKPDADGKDQLMQMVDWLIAGRHISIKESDGLGEHLIVYSKKFAENGTFKDNEDNNAFSMESNSIYTEAWHIWIMSDSSAPSGDNPWGHYGFNKEGDAGSTDGSGNTEIDMRRYYLYTVPEGQTETFFGFVSVGSTVSADNSTVPAYKAKTYGNFLDNIHFDAIFSGKATQTYIRQLKDGDSWTDITEDSIATLDNYTHVDVVGATANSTAAVKEGYEFMGWYDSEGKKVSDAMLKDDGKTLSYTTTGNATYYARFSKIAAAEENENENETLNDSPETGDKSNLEFWTVILLMSMAALTGLFAIRKRL